MDKNIALQLTDPRRVNTYDLTRRRLVRDADIPGVGSHPLQFPLIPSILLIDRYEPRILIFRYSGRNNYPPRPLGRQ